MSKITLVTASALALAAAAPAFAETSANTVLSGGTGVQLKFSGQVNRGVLFTDDGVDTDTFFVDNDNSSTRFRITADGDITEDLSAGINIEIQAESNSTANVTQDQENATNILLTERKLEFYIDSDTYGRLTVGQGDTASNNASEVDLSGTAVVGYSGVEDLAGGLQFRLADDSLSGTSIGAAFTNLDGLSRQDRVRYDTPSLSGFTFSTSAGSDGIYDVAARYKGDFGAFKVDSALAYAVTANDDEIINGSASVLHDSGFSVTLAGGQQDYDDPTDARDTTFGYVKAGYQTDAIASFGTTAFAIDYAVNEDVIIAGDESTSYGLLAVQNIDSIGTELYAGVRQFEYDQPGTSFQDATAVLVGARIRF